MQRCSVGFLFSVAICGLVAVPLHAERGVLVVHVKDVKGHPVVGLEIGPEGDGSSVQTLKGGIARIPLAKQTRSGSWVSLQMVASPKGRDLVMVSPWDGRALVPPFENESDNFVPVVVSERGDRAALENGTVLVAIAAKINKANAPTEKGQPTTEEQRQAALAEVAASFGVTADEVDRAIRAWGERTEDPYEKGLAALYEKNYPEATKELTESLKARESNLAKAQSEMIDAAFFLGRSLWEQGKYRESAGAYQKAANLRPDDPMILNDLALSLMQAGDYVGAEPLLRRALTIDEKALGPDHPYVATGLSNLAELLGARGDYLGADPLLRRALDIDEKALGPDHPSVATDLNNLAGLLKANADYAGAEPLLRRALAIDEKVFGPDHPSVATGLNNLAELLRDAGDDKDAEPLYWRALAIDEKALGPDHPVVATRLNNLGALLAAEGDYTHAEPLYRRALAIAEKALGPDHPAVAIGLNNLAELLRARGDYADAEPLYRRALAIREGALGPNHPAVATGLNNLALLLKDKGDYADAELLYLRALAIDEKALGPDHPEVATRLNNLAALLQAKGDYAGAEPLLRRALAIDEKALGPDHPATESVRSNLEALRHETNRK